MPAILTHDFFGQDAYGSVLQSADLYSPNERDAFLLGNQGPDPLFYLVFLPSLKEFCDLGSNMHHMPPSDLLLNMRRAVDALPEEDQGVGRAYLAGFICHYLLDRAEHPLVVWWERGICQAGVQDLDMSDSGVVHAEIERDLDEMVLYTKRCQTIEVFRPYNEVLRGCDEVLDVVGHIFFEGAIRPYVIDEPTTFRVYPIAVRCFRVAQQLFWSPTGKLTNALARLEQPIDHKRYSLARAMSHRVRAEKSSVFDNRGHNVWTNPFTLAECTASFWDLYQEALDHVGAAVSTVLSNEFDEQAARALTGGLNFSGEPVE